MTGSSGGTQLHQFVTFTRGEYISRSTIAADEQNQVNRSLGHGARAANCVIRSGRVARVRPAQCFRHQPAARAAFAPISSGALRTWKDDKIVDSRLDARTVHGVLSASHGAAAFRFAEYAGPVATFRSNATAYPGNRFDEEPERRRRGITVSG